MIARHTRLADRIRPRSRRPDEDGYILAAVLGLLLVIMLFLGLITDATSTEIVTSARLSNRDFAQSEARSGYDAFLGQLEANPSFITSGAYKNYPAVSGWETINPNGSISPCPTSGVVACYRIKVTNNPAVSSSGLQVHPESATVTVEATYDCNGSGFGFCSDAAYQADLVRRSYLDYLYFNNHESLAPDLYPSGTQYAYSSSCNTTLDTASCLYPVFQANPSGGNADVIDGPVHTNSPWFLVCGDPTFDGVVTYATGGTGATPGPGCSSPNPTFALGEHGVAPIPLPTPTDVSTLEQIAGAKYTYSGNTSIFASASGLTITNGSTTSNLDYPPSGVIYVNGNASIAGVVAGGLTLVATGNISVYGNLTYNCAGPGVNVGTPGWYCTGVGGAEPDMTGLIADGNIQIDWNSGAGLAVDAAMMAIGGTVYTPGWNSSTTHVSSGVQPVLYINGAIVENWQGAFGTYDTSTGTLQSGYAKDFSYDPRMISMQPPWFLTPLAGEWARVSLSAIPPASSGLGLPAN